MANEIGVSAIPVSEVSHFDFLSICIVFIIEILPVLLRGALSVWRELHPVRVLQGLGYVEESWREVAGNEEVAALEIL